ncbi:MAG: hypothetical protein ACKO6F_08915 [Cyanobium sp.]
MAASMLAVTSLASTLPQPSLAATRIRFARGSYCGSYSGNFTGGREFVLGLARGQTFTTQNTGSGNQYSIVVNGPTGRIAARKTSSSSLSFSIPTTGDYYIYMRSTSPYDSVEFCAY